MIVENLPNPKLIERPVQALQTSFSAFTWLEECYGIAQVGEVIRDNKRVRIPVVYRNDGKNYQIELFPDARKTSFGFFEIDGPMSVDHSAGFRDIVYKLNFVAWLNLPKIDLSPYDFTGLLANEVVELLESKKVYAWDAELRKENIFNRYDYDQTEKQFLLYPYSGFKVSFEVRDQSICV